MLHIRLYLEKDALGEKRREDKIKREGTRKGTRGNEKEKEKKTKRRGNKTNKNTGDFKTTGVDDGVVRAPHRDEPRRRGGPGPPRGAGGHQRDRPVSPH